MKQFIMAGGKAAPIAREVIEVLEKHQLAPLEIIAVLSGIVYEVRKLADLPETSFKMEKKK